jgi:hypothetical protein
MQVRSGRVCSDSAFFCCIADDSLSLYLENEEVPGSFVSYFCCNLSDFTLNNPTTMFLSFCMVQEVSFSLTGAFYACSKT